MTTENNYPRPKVRNVARPIKVLWEPRGEREQPMGNECPSIFKMEACLQTQRLNSFLSGSLTSALRGGVWIEGMQTSEVRVWIMTIFQGVPSDCRSCKLWVPLLSSENSRGRCSGCKLEIPPDATLRVLGVLAPLTISLISTFKFLPHSSPLIGAWEERELLTEVKRAEN